ncbi:hypothetical protein GTO10_00145, partial [Candidatus Saccharibacteria bacterium]|nr:hypothetical protein [Candidatus Saccharibacteria bacterium]
FEQGEKVWLAKQLGESYGYSEEMAAKIDAEVKKIIDDSYQAAKEIIKKNEKKLVRIAEKLIEEETIEEEEFQKLIKG